MNLLSTPARRRFLFAALYFAEGAPIGFIWWALPTRLRLAGVSVEQIGWLLGVVVLPWSLKFLWAPAIDTLRGTRWTLRRWIMASQTLMIVTLFPLGRLSVGDDFHWLAICLICHAVAAATQDVAIDALCITTVAPEERGAVNGWMQAGMLLGRSLFGGGALLLGAKLGEQFVWIAMIGAIGLVLCLLALVPEPAAAQRASSGHLRQFARALSDMFRQRNTWVGLAFALTGAAVFEATGAIAGPLLVDRGSTQELNGYFLALPAVATMIAGSLWGGRLSDRLGRVPLVAAATVFIVVVGSLVALVDNSLAGPRRLVGLLALLQLMYGGIGLFSAASYALFMDISSPRLAATQFSTFMGATNGCEAWSAVAAGTLIAAYSYSTALLVMGSVSLLSLGLLPALRLEPSSPVAEQGTERT